MDSEGYPEDDELEHIAQWKVHDGEDLHGWMDYVRERWKYATVGYWTRDDGKYEISTGGWSGNEELIAAMQKNRVAWMLHWYSSRRGGHYEFRTRNRVA